MGGTCNDANCGVSACRPCRCARKPTERAGGVDLDVEDCFASVWRPFEHQHHLSVDRRVFTPAPPEAGSGESTRGRRAAARRRVVDGVTVIVGGATALMSAFAARVPCTRSTTVRLARGQRAQLAGQVCGADGARRRSHHRDRCQQRVVVRRVFSASDVPRERRVRISQRAGSRSSEGGPTREIDVRAARTPPDVGGVVGEVAVGDRVHARAANMGPALVVVAL